MVDESTFDDYGLRLLAPISRKIAFKPLREQLQDPSFLEVDFAKFGVAGQLLLAFRTLNEFRKMVRMLCARVICLDFIHPRVSSWLNSCYE